MFAKRLAELHPYRPGEQPSDREYIKLNANENPYPPSPAVTAELSSIHPETLGLYPDPESENLREAICGMLNATGGTLAEKAPKNELSTLRLTPDMIFPGNGSDEVLSFIFYSLFEGSDPLLIPEHTYSFYPVYASYYGIPLRKLPLRSNLAVDVGAFVTEPSCGVIFANPNAPTGVSLSRSDIRRLLETYPGDKAVVVDEAYVDFGGETVLPLLAEHKNLVVIRTFSKSMSFAGMRLGFAIAHPEVISAFTTVKNSFNHFPVDVICQRAGISACSDINWYIGNCRKVIASRERFCRELKSIGWTYIPSATNFVLAGKPGISGEEAYRAIKAAGILVRYFDIPGIREYVRITIGTDAQMDTLLSVMKRI